MHGEGFIADCENCFAVSLCLIIIGRPYFRIVICARVVLPVHRVELRFAHIDQEGYPIVCNALPNGRPRPAYKRSRART